MSRAWSHRAFPEDEHRTHRPNNSSARQGLCILQEALPDNQRLQARVSYPPTDQIDALIEP